MEAILYRPEKSNEWDSFVLKSNNGTMFHKQSFLAYHRDRFGSRWRHLMFYRGDKLMAVLPGAMDGSTYRSPTGASYGGFVVPRYARVKEANEIVRAFIRYCHDHDIQEVFLTPPMTIYHTSPDDVMEYAMMYNQFTPLNALYSSVIDIDQVRGREHFEKKRRYLVNKAEKMGVTIIDSKEWLTSFYRILQDNKKRFDATPVHSLGDMVYLSDSYLFTAWAEDNLLAGVWVLPANDNCALIFYCASDENYKHYNAVDALIEYTIRWCHKHQFKYLDYGVSANTAHIDLLEPSWSLVRFKERMRATGCLRRTYYRRIY